MILMDYVALKLQCNRNPFSLLTDLIFENDFV